jgi:DNA-3-methyladenine glycosylase II
VKTAIRHAAVAHLQRVDPKMGEFIGVAGPCTLTRRQDRFQALARAILAQQISAHVANVIRNRIVALCAPDSISPAALLRLGEGPLRAVGCSRQKIAYLLDLASKVHSGELPLHHLGRLSNEAVIERLVAVKGIGVWTAKMFLIFSLSRPDVFPHEDLAVRVGIQKIYGLKTLPARRTSERIATRWKPYASVGAWYCWRWHYLYGSYKPKQ